MRQMNGLSCTHIADLTEDYFQDCCLPDAFKEIEKELLAPPKPGVCESTDSCSVWYQSCWWLV